MPATSRDGFTGPVTRWARLLAGVTRARPRGAWLAALVVLAGSVAPAGAQALAFQDDLQAMVSEIVARHPASSLGMLANPAPLDPGRAVAQTAVNAAGTAAQTGGDADSITLNFQNADIRALINTIARITGKNFIVDPRVKGRITLVSGSRLKPDQIYDIFLSVLDVHHFAAVPSGSIIKILPGNLVKQAPTPTFFDDSEPDTDEQITQVYTLKHSSVRAMVPILRPLLPPTSHFAAHSASNSLIFTDTAANIRRILQIIHRIDRPGRRAEVHVVFIKHGNAEELAKLLSDFSGTIRTPGGTSAAPDAPGKKVVVQAEPGLNALIVQAPAAQYQLMHALIDQLDIPRSDQGNIHVVYLKHARAKDLVTVLNEIIGQKQAATKEGAPPAAPVSIQADEGTNALVIRAGRKDFSDLQAVIDKLDIRRAQVFVEAIIAEVATNKEADIGVQWQGVYFGKSGAQYSGNTNALAGKDGGIKIGVVNKFVPAAGADGTAVVIPDLQVILKALRTDGDTNILSTPNLLTLDNQEAEIQVGQEVPFLTGQFVTSASGSDNQTSGIDNPFQTIERKEVGLTLKITPQINEGNTIQLKIEQESSNVSPVQVAGAADLITDKRTINTTAQVDDGQIIVLGGLIDNNTADSVSWVPILGKIPIIGALFRHKNKTARKRNLMVFLRPKIIRTPRDLAAFTRERYEYLQNQQGSSLRDTRSLLKKDKPAVLPLYHWDDEGRER